MRAMRLLETGPIEKSPLRDIELPDPKPGRGQVRVKITCCAICRTDLHVIEGDLPPARRPVIPGHQAVGIVDALGEDCKTLRIGQRVGIAWLGSACGHCDYCNRGSENLCETPEFTGYTLDGGYATHALAREDFVYPLPENLSDIQAAPLLCAGIIGYRSLLLASVPAGGSLALYGFGSSAHIVIQLALHRGHRIYVVTRDEKHRKLALDLGAQWAGASAEAMPVSTDSAILFAPVGSLVPPALEKLRRGGTLALAGIYVSDIPSLNYQKHLFQERVLRSVTCNRREDGRELLREAAQIPIRPHTRVYPLSEANAALADMKADRIAGTGVLVI